MSFSTSPSHDISHMTHIAEPLQRDQTLAQTQTQIDSDIVTITIWSI